MVGLVLGGGVLYLGYLYIKKQPASAPSGQATTPTIVYVTGSGQQSQPAQQTPQTQIIYLQSPAQPAAQQAVAYQGQQGNYNPYGDWYPNLDTGAKGQGAPSSSPSTVDPVSGPDWLGCV